MFFFIYEWVFRIDGNSFFLFNNTAGSKGEGGLSGKLWQDGRSRTAKLRGIRKISGIQDERIA